MAHLKTIGIAWVLCGIVGCVSTITERKRLLNDDGIHQFAQGNYREARDSFEMALILKPRDPGLIFNLGQCHDRLGESDKAEPYYRECLEIDANNADARYALVRLLYRTGRAQEANGMVETWLKDSKNRPDGLVLEAWRLMEERSYPQAHYRLQQALFIDSHHARALIQLGIYHEIMNQPERALVCYERALDRDPKQFEVRQRIEALQAKGIKRPLPEN